MLILGDFHYIMHLTYKSELDTWGFYGKRPPWKQENPQMPSCAANIASTFHDCSSGYFLKVGARNFYHFLKMPIAISSLAAYCYC